MTETGTSAAQHAAGSVEQPRTVAAAAGLLQDTRGSVLLRGRGTKLDWAGRVDTPDLVLDTTELRGVLTHNPGDMTASARAGTPLAELQDHLAGSGQWLALDPPTARAGATVGGLLAAGDSGPSRLRYGGLRDLVIGVTLVLADGQVARSGGQVIKNVAGYDLAKLMYGSLGSLALVAEVVVRLHPRPPASLTTAGAATPRQATAAALALMAGPLEPAALEWVSDDGSGGGSGQLLVRTDGTPSYVEAATERVNALLATQGVPAHPLPGTDATAAWRTQADAVVGGAGEVVLRISGLPSDFGELAERSRRVAGECAVDLAVASSVALGLHTIRLREGTPQDLARAVLGLRQAALAQGASVLLRSRPPELDDLLDPLGPPPSAVAVLRRVKEQFDPAGRLAPGRFQPWY
ncbi:MAG: FAD-binding oxidoreductase [Friedmanniella sp.]